MKITLHEINGNPAVTLENNGGLVLKLCSLGAGIAGISVPDKHGVARELTKLSEKGYGAGHNGLTTGRTAGRIANATFTVDGKTAVLEKNNFGVDNLHGGSDALHKKVFAMHVKEGSDKTDVVFAYRSVDGEGGYFGNVDVTVTYSVRENENAFAIIFEGAPDCKTLLNITNHVYLNAAGVTQDSDSIVEQEMYINASRVGKLNERSVTVDIVPVSEEFDFRTPHKIGDHINAESVQRYANGYDHPFFLDSTGLDKIACSLYSAASGIKISVSTTYPCAVVYTDNADGNKAVCFECQFHPDGIHACPDNCGLCSPQQPYKQVMKYEFTTVK